MLKSLKAMLEKRLSLIVLVILIIQPAMDVLSYFLSGMGSNAISTALRFLLLAAVALLGFVVSDKKKIYFIFYGIVGVFWALHMANCFRIGYTSMVADAGNFLRIMNFPIFTLSFITFFQKGKNIRKSIYLGFAINFGEIILFTALPWLLGQPVYTYEQLNVGVLGWFAIPSAQSAIILLVVPLAIYWAYRTKKYPVFLAVALLCFALMFATGTKFTFYSIFIITGAYSFLFVMHLGKKSIKYVVPLILVFVVVFGLRNVSPMAERERLSAVAQSNYSTLISQSLANIGADEELIATLQEGFDPDSTSEEMLENLRRSLIGVYTDKEVYGSVLGNLHERFGVYNVMDAYEYTTEPGILSDSRVRKSIFAKLVWEEKDFLTKLLGFEYSDMLMGDAIYDLENDFPAIYYFCGYIGFGLYMLFFVYFAFIILRAFYEKLKDSYTDNKRAISARLEAGEEVKNRPVNKLMRGVSVFWQGLKSFLTVEMGAVGMTFLLAILVAQMSGNVLRRPNVTAYFAAAAATVYHLTVDARKARIAAGEITPKKPAKPKKR